MPQQRPRGHIGRPPLHRVTTGLLWQEIEANRSLAQNFDVSLRLEAPQHHEEDAVVVLLGDIRDIFDRLGLDRRGRRGQTRPFGSSWRPPLRASALSAYARGCPGRLL
jgi:hypothetical protein